MLHDAFRLMYNGNYMMIIHRSFFKKFHSGKNEKNSSDTFSKLNNQAKSNKIIPLNNKTLVYLIFRPE
jgi:hypothetical protein